MKARYISAIVCLLLIMLAGCSSAQTPQATAAKVPAGYERVTMVGSSIGSASNTAVITIANVLNKYYPEIEWSSRSGTAGATPIQITEGQFKIGTSSSGLWALAYKFSKPADQSRLRSLHTAHPNQNICWLAPKDKPWTDITQVPKGTNVCPGSPGTIIPEMAKTWLEVCGRSPSDFNWLEMGKSAMADAFRSGKIDLTFQNVDPAIGWLYDVSAARKGVKIIGFTPEQAKAAVEPFKKLYCTVEMGQIASEYDPDLFNPGDDVLLTKIQNTVVSRDDFSEEIAYKMAKVLDEHHDDLVKAWPGFKWSDAKFNVKYGDTPATRLHKGVVKYYKEKGYLPASYVPRDN